ncbi:MULTISPECIES: NlpC/P60 family protein [unclassified Streptomyces]|uniref:C40 family peptidase n=1 Tax=unclassified Streptomyces TaxID=2593676 RepID=UPI00224E4421|nr:MULTISPECIES: NlpC/P60 family protein [unclassified Streptomyces]MCX4527620.1 NlpC/P60 family protein [Streptomyces sp. NBC_01551]MCX4541782.1 NlpC/P60 family protein [Streptomyces sp. NBC_01565]
MASHRKPRQRPLSGGTVRTAATLALAGAATATAFEGTSQAEPQLSPAQVKAEVDRLYEEAEAATEKYNGAKEKADEAQRALTTLRDETARKTDRLNTARRALGSLAASQYRAGGLGTAVQLATADNPQDYLDRASFMTRTGDRNAAEIASVRRQLDEVGQLRKQAGGRLTDLRARQAELAEHKAAVEGKLSTARQLLARLTAEERAAYEARSAAAPTPSAGARQAEDAPAAPAAQTPPPADGSRAARAVSFAYGAIGKPYVWGATGPGSFDCSGLTQAAWRSAGVSLPRTTYTQINAGRRVSRDQLAPGDLVFFYSGVTHVGLYVGNGQMIHAPRPGSTVRLAPVDSMPWAGASRPS